MENRCFYLHPDLHYSSGVQLVGEFVMTDRELLELAAKAVGYDTSHHWNAERMQMCPPVIGLCIPGVHSCWNPLEDSGNALDMAVSLRLKVSFGDHIVVVSDGSEDGYCTAFTIEELEPDERVATRRAIVCAAAQLGMVRNNPVSF